MIRIECGEKFKAPYPDCYLHVTENQSGTQWIMPMRGNSVLDLETQVKNWIKKEFCGELALNGQIGKVAGDYYAQIKTDGREPDSVVCWTAGAFYLKSTY